MADEHEQMQNPQQENIIDKDFDYGNMTDNDTIQVLGFEFKWGDLKEICDEKGIAYKDSLSKVILNIPRVRDYIKELQTDAQNKNHEIVN